MSATLTPSESPGRPPGERAGPIGSADHATRALVASAPIGMYHADECGQITYVNPEYRRILSLGPEQNLDAWALGIHSDDRARMQAARADFCRNPRPVTFEWRAAPRGGVSGVLVEQVVTAVGIAGFVGTIVDISERAQARERLLPAETLFSNTIEQTPIGIAYADRDGRIIRCNPAYCAMLGFGPGELVKRTIGELTLPEDVDKMVTELGRLWSGEIAFSDIETRYARKVGGYLCARATTTLIRGERGTSDCTVQFLQDITAHKGAELALQQNRMLLKAVILDVPVAIRACDVDGQIFLHNHAAKELFASLGAGSSVAQSSWGMTQAPATFLSDGVTRVVEQDRPLERALRGEIVTNAELVIVPVEGKARRIITSTRPLIGDDGVSLGAVAVTEDVTQRRALEVELLQAQKLESIGHLSAGIAHEINTPTQFIGDNIRFLRDTFQEIFGLVGQLTALVEDHDGVVTAAPLVAVLKGSDVSYLLEEIPKAIAQSLEGVERIAKIVGAMKDFSHPGVDRTPVDLNRAIASTITVASNEWKYVADIKTEFDAALPFVPVMPGPFNQVILNMIVNAAQAIGEIATEAAPSKGLITVTTRLAGDWVEVDIADTGCGMTPDIAARVFDQFFTTKPVGKGTGQGLAIAHDIIVNKHGGTIAVNSEPGVGTTFTLRLALEGMMGTA